MGEEKGDGSADDVLNSGHLEDDMWTLSTPPPEPTAAFVAGPPGAISAISAAAAGAEGVAGDHHHEWDGPAGAPAVTAASIAAAIEDSRRSVLTPEYDISKTRVSAALDD